MPSCSVCTNNSSHKDNNAVAILKPNVVFFGDNVPRLASQAAMKIVCMFFFLLVHSDFMCIASRLKIAMEC